VVERREPTEATVFGTEEALAKISLELLDPSGEKLFTVSDITAEEIFGLNTALAFAKLFKSKLIDDVIRKFLLLRVSRFRVGRKEFILLATGIKEASEERRRRGKITDVFAGLR
jgi:hypothetical protein